MAIFSKDHHKFLALLILGACSGTPREIGEYQKCLECGVEVRL